MIMVSTLNGGDIFTVSFSKQDLTITKKDTFDFITVKRCILNGEIGTPILPHKRLEILIPSDKIFKSVKVLNSSKIPIKGNFKIYPAQPPIKMDGTPPSKNLIINKKIYCSPKPFPKTQIIFTGTEKIAGNKIVCIDVVPVTYFPQNGKLYLITSVTFELFLEDKGKPPLSPHSRTLISNNFIKEYIKKRVYNKNLVDYLPVKYKIFNSTKVNPETKLTKPSSDDKPKDFLIITDESLADYFEPLAQLKKEMGLSTTIVTTNWIENNYSGRDLPEKIRNFLNDAYLYWGITWVLIGGDVTVVPTRFVDYKSWEYNGMIPTDLYYSDLDGDWDANGNGIFGEYIYGSNIDSVEGSPDIFVGRIPIETSSEVQQYIEKENRYELNPDTTYLSKILFLGGSIYQGGTDGWGGINSEYIINNYLPSEIEPHRLYAPLKDTLMNPPRWSGDELLNSATTIINFNTGYNIINHLDHGAYDAIGTGVMNGGGYFHWYDADNLQNSEKPSILWTISCSSNAFDLNSVSEHFINSKTGLVYIGNTRVGWTTQLFQDYSFFNSIFTDSVTNIGAAFATTLYNSLYYRIVMNMLGDPTISIWTKKPERLSVDNKKTLFLPVDSITFTVKMKNIPLKGARIVVKKEDEGIKRIAVTNAAGEAKVYLKCKKTGNIDITVTYPNTYPYFNSLYVYPPEKPNLFAEILTQRVKRGSVQKIQTTCSNNGRMQAEGVYMVISSLDSLVTIKNTVLKFGTIPPLSSKSISNCFLIKVDKNCPIGKTIKLPYDLFDRYGNKWSDTLRLTIDDDMLSYAGYTALLNNTSYIKNTNEKIFSIPSIKIKNSGFFPGKNINIFLKTDNPLIDVIDSVIHMEYIPAKTTKQTNDGFLFKSYCDLNAKFNIIIKDENGKNFVKTIDFVPPGKVSSITTEPLEASLKLHWVKPSDNDILGYNIYRKVNNDWGKITEEPIAFTGFEDFSIIPGEQYFYRISTIDSSFNESLLSDSIPAASNPPLFKGWPAYIGPGGYSVYSGKRLYDRSSPAFGDIDGDGENEIVVGSDDGKLYAYKLNGAYLTNWPIKIGFPIENSPAICDLDNDGKDEVIIGGGIFDTLSIYILKGNGSSYMPGIWPKNLGGYPLTSPVVDDINSDEKYEIGIGCSNNKVYFINIDGTSVNGWPVTVNSPVGIATADIDGDSYTDIVVASSNGTIYVFNSNGTQKEGWPKTLGSNIYSGIALADIDNDGKVEIIVGTSSGKLYILLPDGTIKNGWPVNLGERVAGIPAIGEVDDEPGLEIVVSTVTNHLYVFKDSAELLFEKQLLHLVNNYFASPLLVDINNDSRKEIVVNTLEGYIYAFSYEGINLLGFPIFYGNGSFSTTACGNINGNRILNLVLKGSDKKIYLWKLNNSHTTCSEKWFKFAGNNRNTCFYNTKKYTSTLEKSYSFPKTIQLQLYPNPFDKKVTIKYSLNETPAKMNNKIFNITLVVYDIAGRRIYQFKEKSYSQGILTWNGNIKGKKAPSGIYFMKITISSGKTKKVFLRKLIKLSATK